MTSTDREKKERLLAWSRGQLKHAVDAFLETGAIESPLVEAKPAWAFPYSVLIAQVREQGEPSRFWWVISGSVPFDYLDSAAAATPREAARHFALKWQLDAARKRQSETGPFAGSVPGDEGGQAAGELERQAESLHELVLQDSLWADATS